MPTESEIIRQLEDGLELPPLEIRVRELVKAADTGVDAILDVKTGNKKSFQFAAQVKARNTPRAFEESLLRLEYSARKSKSNEPLPLLVVPYFSESQLDQLERLELSGIDLSGNGVVCVPGKLLVYRSGKPNQFPESTQSKYAYRGVTSLVARAFLCRTRYDSLADIESEIKSRGGTVSLSTISKALKRMESDLIVDRTGQLIRLRQADKLLDKLAASYVEPKTTQTVTCASQKPLSELLANVVEAQTVVLSGSSSVDGYAVMGRDAWPVLYTSNVKALREAWGKNVESTSRFVDFELQQTDDATVYFDARMRNDLPYASPVQVYLQLSAGDKRERETALQVKEFIMDELKDAE
ncbi:MAG: hypothetical protein H6822_19250 [Planctomycetaceae bacterium]|nr:hypothetical protein [Planctomycetales bacterium]MCB9924323.1 hypothetical protein [Planctomycetaceae bacterium]